MDGFLSSSIIKPPPSDYLTGDITMVCYTAGILLLLMLSAISVSTGHDLIGDFLRPAKAGNDGSNGTRWAVLVAGSNYYLNYRHQADVCHAYQILKRNGIKDENIVVFMYDDIAFNKDNPRPGVIINSPQGSDVYQGVPKDYTGENVTINNLFSVILGNRSALTGGSGKVVDSGPDDRIFIYYTDHGGAGVLGMPNEVLYAVDLIAVLKKKHASGTYKSLVFYLEACEAGSIFDGLLTKGLNIYVTTASNAYESSYGTYCTGQHPSPPPEYIDTCLGDLYSVAWMEDCDTKDLQTETLEQQYKLVKKRTKNGNYKDGSHVMQYGDLILSKDNLSGYMGTNTSDDNFTYLKDNSVRPSSAAVNQRDTDLLYFWHKYQNAPEGSTRKFEAQKQFTEVMSHRTHIDDSVKLIGKLLFGVEKGPDVLNAVRPAGQPLVDDWDCLKTLVKMFEAHCGSLSRYGLKYMRSFANLCNVGITKEQMTEASARTCVTFPSNSLSSLHKGFRA